MRCAHDAAAVGCALWAKNAALPMCGHALLLLLLLKLFSVLAQYGRAKPVLLHVSMVQEFVQMMLKK